MPEELNEGGITLDGTEKFEDQYEKIPYERTLTEQIDIAKAVTAFEEDRHNASFSKRNPDLGKMISCSLCGMRHRVHDLVMLNSTAHGEQVFGDIKYPSRTTAFAKKRLHPHFTQNSRDLVQGIQKLILVYGEEKLDVVRGIIRARLAREHQPSQTRARNQQKRNRRINWGLLCF